MMGDNNLTTDYANPIDFNPYLVHIEDSTGRELNVTVDEIIDLFLFVKKLKEGKDEFSKSLEHRFKQANEVKKNES